MLLLTAVWGLAEIVLVLLSSPPSSLSGLKLICLFRRYLKKRISSRILSIHVMIVFSSLGVWTLGFVSNVNAHFSMQLSPGVDADHGASHSIQT